MKIAAALSWFAEPPEALARCVESLAGLADVLVAFDGRWEGFDADHDLSSPDERVAIERAAAGRTFVVDEPLFVWPSQVEKRAALYARAAQLADWVLAIDGDEWVERCDPAALRALLAGTDRMLGTVHMAGPDGRMGVRRRVFRASEGLTVEHAHNGVRTLTGRWLAGDRGYVPLETPVDLTGVLELGHDRGASRSADRNRADHLYRMHRRVHGSERWKRERVR